MQLTVVVFRLFQSQSIRSTFTKTIDATGNSCSGCRSYLHTWLHECRFFGDSDCSSYVGSVGFTLTRGMLRARMWRFLMPIQGDPPVSRAESRLLAICFSRIPLFCFCAEFYSVEVFRIPFSQLPRLIYLAVAKTSRSGTFFNVVIMLCELSYDGHRYRPGAKNQYHIVPTHVLEKKSERA